MKTKIRILIPGLFFILLAQGLLFAVETSFSKSPRALGVQVGRISGIGLSYQKWSGNSGFQVAAGGMYHPLMDDGHDILNYNMGIEFQQAIYTDDFSTWLSGRLYLFTGLNHRGYLEAIETAVPDVYEKGDFHPEFGIGGGVGVEAIFFEHFAVVTEMVYVLFWHPIQPVFHEQFVVDILPQVSLRYRY